MSYKGKVVVNDPELRLSSDSLKIKYPVGGADPVVPIATDGSVPALWGGRKVEWADAQGNVVIVDLKNDARVTGVAAKYTATNNLLFMPGSGMVIKPHNATTNWAAAATNEALIKPQIIFLGDDMTLDRANGTISGRNHKTYYWADLVKTNQPVVPKPAKKP